MAAFFNGDGQIFHKFGHILRQGRGEFQPLAGDGVRKAEQAGMQRLSRETPQCLKRLPHSLIRHLP